VTPLSTAKWAPRALWTQMGCQHDSVALPSFAVTRQVRVLGGTGAEVAETCPQLLASELPCPGNMFVSEYNYNVVRRIDLWGNVVSWAGQEGRGPHCLQQNSVTLTERCVSQRSTRLRELRITGVARPPTRMAQWGWPHCAVQWVWLSARKGQFMLQKRADTE
jgi:hypothetical protein